MGQIQRYNVVYEPGKRTMQPFEHGGWVRTTDHLEAIAAKDEQIRQLREALQNEFSNMKCICNMIGYIGEKPPCGTCRLKALLEGPSD